MKYFFLFLAGFLAGFYIHKKIGVKKTDCLSGVVITTCIDPDAVALGRKHRRAVWTNQ